MKFGRRVENDGFMACRGRNNMRAIDLPKLRPIRANDKHAETTDGRTDGAAETRNPQRSGL